MSLKALKKAAGWYSTARQGKRTVEIDLHVMQSLAFMHREKLEGRCEPLDNGRSVYHPDRPSRFTNPKRRSPTQRHPAGPPWDDPGRS